jgi:hypothetical protein
MRAKALGEKKPLNTEVQGHQGVAEALHIPLKIFIAEHRNRGHTFFIKRKLPTGTQGQAAASLNRQTREGRLANTYSRLPEIEVWLHEIAITNHVMI